MFMPFSRANAISPDKLKRPSSRVSSGIVAPNRKSQFASCPAETLAPPKFTARKSAPLKYALRKTASLKSAPQVNEKEEERQKKRTDDEWRRKKEARQKKRREIREASNEEIR